MTLTEHALRGSVLTVGADHRLDVGLPWFRSMPASAIVAVEVTVDGRRAEDVRLELDEEHWFLQDRHPLRWRRTDEVGRSADVVVQMRLHLPFTTGPGGASVQVVQEVRATVPVEAAS